LQAAQCIFSPPANPPQSPLLGTFVLRPSSLMALESAAPWQPDGRPFASVAGRPAARAGRSQ